MTLFDWLKEINVTKSNPDTFTDEDWKSFTPYMIHRYLSLHEELLDVVNHVQKFVSFSKPVIYDMYRRMLPKQPRFAKYIKGKKQVKYDTELIEIMCKHYEVSKNEVTRFEASCS